MIKKITLFVIAIGDQEYKKYSIEILKDFFSKYENIDLFFLENAGEQNIKNAHPSWLKLISHKYIDNNNFILCWDLDLLPNNKNVEIDFKDFDFDKINMCYDTSVVLNYPRFNNNFYFNGGLVGIPTSKRNTLESIYLKYAPGTYPSYEQYYLNDFINETQEPINILSNKYNTLYHDGELFKESNFSHYTWQCDNNQRNELIKNHYEQYFRN